MWLIVPSAGFGSPTRRAAVACCTERSWAARSWTALQVCSTGGARGVACSCRWPAAAAADALLPWPVAAVIQPAALGSLLATAAGPVLQPEVELWRQQARACWAVPGHPGWGILPLSDAALPPPGAYVVLPVEAVAPCQQAVASRLRALLPPAAPEQAGTAELAPPPAGPEEPAGAEQAPLPSPFEMALQLPSLPLLPGGAGLFPSLPKVLQGA